MEDENENMSFPAGVGSPDQADFGLTAKEAATANEFMNIFTNGDPDFEGEFDQSGKADDAEDFMDISDDDLPEEEEATGADVGPPQTLDIPGLTDDGGTNDTDDLFGEGDGRASSPLDIDLPSSPLHPPASKGVDGLARIPDLAGFESAGDDDAFAGLDVPVGLDNAHPANQGPSDFDVNFPQSYDLEQNQDPNIPSVAQTPAELVKSVWPTFDTGVIFDFNQLLPPKKPTYLGKTPHRNPKPLAITKLSLDLDVDQEKLFRIPGPASGTTRQKIQDAESKGLVSCLVPEPIEPEDLAIFRKDLEDDSETVAGYTLADIETICYDFESMIDGGVAPPTPPLTPPNEKRPAEEDDDDAEWDRMFLDEPAPKRRKIVVESGLPRIPRFKAPNFDQFEEATVRAAKRVHFDLSDPYLLLEEETPNKRRKLNQPRGRLGRDVKSRFNFSNDDAYEQLKVNHKSKVRAAIGSVAVEHSVPAIKLLWPYYAVRLLGIDPYEYHRPTLQTKQNCGANVRFVQPTFLKRKEKRAQKIQDTYAESKDLALNDNSFSVLFEYAEQIPTVLSNFGMGNKIINHARKKAADEEQPSIDKKTYELGEPNILHLEDKSPFSIFGKIEPGEVVPTLQNPMFHAPIFKHQPRKTDFLCGRTTTAAGGSNYYLRKIDHLYVVGQNFPTAEVPNPHSRKITSMSKNRLKMISYRLIHNKGSASLQDVTAHMKDSNDSQNRQKLKEFLAYNKETKSWGMRGDEKLMDMEEINAMIRPEDVCLLDAQMVGENELLLNGYTVEKDKGGKAGDKDRQDDLDPVVDDKESFAKAMAPWATTKAFIDACAGKAMVRLRGPGDPTGHGLGFSFIKTSMKGGYMEAIQNDRGPGTTSADALEAQRRDANGHSYNVKEQEALYMKEIGEIWAKQRATLSDPTEHADEDLQPRGDEDDRLFAGDEGPNGAGPSQPHTGVPPTPSAAYNGLNPLDETTSVFSRRSATDAGAAAGGKKRMLRIIRRKLRPNGEEGEEDVETVVDPGVIRRYMKEKASSQAEVDLFSGNVEMTGDMEKDKAILNQIEIEQARLLRNKERRIQREKSKASHGGRLATPLDRDPDSPAPSIENRVAGGGGGTGTQRKCANCGQKGHIKTNKKLCPMLNGTWTAPAGGAEEAGGFGDVSSSAPGGA